MTPQPGISHDPGVKVPSGKKSGSWPNGERVSITDPLVSITAIVTGMRMGVSLEYSWPGTRVVGRTLVPGSIAIASPWYSGTIRAALMASIGVPFSLTTERFQSGETPYAVPFNREVMSTGVEFSSGTGRNRVTFSIVEV